VRKLGAVCLSRLAGARVARFESVRRALNIVGVEALDKVRAEFSLTALAYNLVGAEIGDGLEIGLQRPQQPDDLDVAMTLGLQPAARPRPVQKRRCKA